MSDAPDTTVASTEEEAVDEVPRDEVREQLVADLTSWLGDGVVDHHIIPGKDLWVRVTTEAWQPAAVALHGHGFEFFSFLSAIDWMPSPYGKSEDNPDEPPPERDDTIKQGYTGGETRFQVFARVVDIDRHLGVTLKADVPDEVMAVESWIAVYAGANWHEREANEMFGIDFVGHPDLRHMYLPGDFEGYPLRKDFPLLARMIKPWPGIVDVEPLPPEPEEDEDEAPAELPSADADATSAGEGSASDEPDSGADEAPPSEDAS